MYIGHKIKELRKSQKMTLEDLSEKSGVQIATLSRIENMKMTGSIDSHMNIAKALGVDITQLYANIIKEDRAAEAKEEKAMSEMFVHSDKSSYEILTNKLLSKKMMPVLLKIDSGGKTNAEQNILGSEKFIFILDGKLEVHVGDQSYPLSKNNSLYFDASQKHYFVNQGRVTAKAICVLTPVSL